MFNQVVMVLFFTILFPVYSWGQGCTNYATVVFDSYEYTTVCAEIVPGTVYHNTPQTFAGCVRTGARGLYLNIVNGYAGPVYDRTFNNICVGATYRFSFSTKDTWNASNNINVNIYDGGNNLLLTQNVINNGAAWNDIVMAPFVAPTNTIRFEIVTNTPGGGGNDMGFDDLLLETCALDPYIDDNVAICQGQSAHLFDSLDIIPVSQNGAWTGPTGLNNGYLGTYTGGPNIPGDYIYTIAGIAGCPDTVLNITVVENSGANAGPGNTATYCYSGETIDINNFVDPGADPGGFFTETSTNPSGQFNSANGLFDTQGLSGNFEFAYVVLDATCANDTAFYEINIDNATFVWLGNDTTICQGDLLLLDAGPNAASYLWQNGTTIQTATAVASGIYWCEVGSLGSDIINNGDFENGNTGFNSDYTVGTGGAWGQLSNPGTYAINVNPNNTHNNFSSCGDHTSGNGNMMIVNGANTAGSSVWCQTVNVQPNTDYQFSTWAMSVVNGANVAQLQFSINGSTLGTVFSPSSTSCIWSEFAETWNSGANTTAQICIVNQNTAGGGNDFAIDDISFNQVCTYRDSIQVTVDNGPVVDLGPDQTVCETETVVLDAGNPGLAYLWHDNSTNQTMVASGTGNYEVTVTNGFDCSNTDDVNLTFESLPNAGTDQSTLVCDADGTLDLNNMLDPVAEPGTWSEISSSGQFNTATGVLNLIDLNGNYTFNYTVFGNQCPDSIATFDVSINTQPNAGLDHSTSICNASTDQIDLTTLLDFGVSGGIWTDVNNTGQLTGNNFNPDGLSEGNYQFNYTISGDAPCIDDEATITVEVLAYPEVNFLADVVLGCAPLTVNFEQNPTNSGNWTCQWDFGNGEISNQCDFSTITYQSAGLYDITLTVTNANLCTSSFEALNYIEVYDQPVAGFSTDPQIILAEDATVITTNNSLFASDYYWTFGDGQSTEEMEPIHTYPIGSLGNYEVTLYATNEIGCVDSSTQIITIVDELLFYVPNAFTPDGDEYNQTFMPIMTTGYDPYDYHLMIYNRYGELLFESYNAAVGWDGSYGSQGLVDDGVYIWVIDVGNPFNDERQLFRGHVTLIK